MSRSTLLPGTDELSLDCIKAHRNAITVVVHAARPAARCPGCGSSSRRIHSHYAQRLEDLPWNGIALHLQLRTRRFFCAAEGCGQRIFTERLPDTVVPHGRRTRRLKHVLASSCLSSSVPVKHPISGRYPFWEGSLHSVRLFYGRRATLQEGDCAFTSLFVICTSVPLRALLRTILRRSVVPRLA